MLSFKYASNFKVTYTLPKHKKKDESSIYRYSHISPILPTFFKIYEWCAYGQIYKYFDQIFSSKCEYSFLHNYSTQNYLLAVVKKWKGRCLDKVVDCIKHDLFIAKLVTCGSESLSLKFVLSYLVKENKEEKNTKPLQLLRSYSMCISTNVNTGLSFLNINIFETSFKR